MRVGIYGGCFNPIHFGHMSLIDEVSDKFNLDKVIFVPNLNPYYKVHREIKFEDVSSMIRLAMKDNILFQISDLESSTKEVGEDIVIGYTTAMKSDIPTRYLDPIKVKGKKDDIIIYTID